METKDMKTIGAGGLPTIGAPVSSGTSGDVVITPDVKYESYTAASGDTSITDILPEEGEEDVIYRVGNWDGTEVDATKMSEYAWDGSDYTLLRVVDSISSNGVPSRNWGFGRTPLRTGTTGASTGSCPPVSCRRSGQWPR